LNFKDYLTEFKQENKSYVFDIDDTLVTTDAKIHVISGNEKVTSLTPEDFNTYKLQDGEEFDFSDFSSTDILHSTGKKTKYWQIAQNVNDAIKRGSSKSSMYVLTARPPSAKKGLHSYLKSLGLSELELKNIYTVGDRGATMTVAQLKKTVLRQIKKHHKELTFFDDDTKNIDLANELKSIKAVKVKV
jgi:hypothetical protein